MPRRNGKRRGATLYDFRDLDLLLKVEDEADDEGWIETGVMADALGFGANLMPISRRFSWLRRYGMLDYDDRRHMWRLTDGALRVTEAQLRAAQARTLKELPDEAMVSVMESVTTHYRHASPMMANLLRREFLFGTQRR